MSNIRKTIVSNCEKKFLTKSLGDWVRIDGRTFDEFRKFDISFGKDWGCCYVSLGKTKVVAQVSCEVQVPKSSRPSEGILNINIELTPIAAPNFEAGRQSDLSVQLNRLLEKCIKDSKAVDLESLCIKANEKVWAFRVDINVLNHEGNILDCASVAALTALAHFRRPDVTCDGEEFIVHTYQQRDPIPTVIHHYPVCITYAIFDGGEYVLADPTYLEEGVADAFLSVGLNAYKELCGLHLGGKSELAVEAILQTTSKAANHAGRIVLQIKESIEQDHKKRDAKEAISFHKDISQAGSSDTAAELSECLDQWSLKQGKKSRKEKRSEKMEEEKVQVQEAKVEVFDKGSAALVPREDSNKLKWGSDEEEDEEEPDVRIIEKPIETMIIDSDGSEEDAVVVLNADQKTNKKKKIRK